MTKSELIAKVKSLDLDKERRNSVVCSMIGHSGIISVFWGYVHCGRCGDQIGDRLGSSYDTSDKVLIGHACETCRENYKKLTWKDKLYVPNPFKQPAPAAEAERE